MTAYIGCSASFHRLYKSFIHIHFRRTVPNEEKNALHWSVCAYLADSGKNFFNWIMWADTVQGMEKARDFWPRNCVTEFPTLIMKEYAIAIGIHASSHSRNVQHWFLYHERVVGAKSPISITSETHQSKTQRYSHQSRSAEADIHNQTSVDHGETRSQPAWEISSENRSLSASNVWTSSFRRGDLDIIGKIDWFCKSLRKFRSTRRFHADAEDGRKCAIRGN
jgi:hypothetical protein